MLLWLLSVGFGLRVLGQVVQRWWPQRFLPSFESFQGSNLPYAVLLATQLVILAVMVRTSWRVQRETLVPRVRVGKVLGWFGALYMGGSLARLVIGLVVDAAPAWFEAWLPAVFHLVLAGFVLALARYHRRRRPLLVEHGC